MYFIKKKISLRNDNFIDALFNSAKDVTKSEIRVEIS